jgi:exonuclease VII small subunit
MPGNCFGEGMMAAQYLYKSLSEAKMEIKSLRKGYEVAGSLSVKNIQLLELENKMKEIENIVKNLGCEGHFPSDLILEERIWACLKKIKEEICFLVEELKKCPETFNAYCVKFRDLFEMN